MKRCNTCKWEYEKKFGENVFYECWRLPPAMASVGRDGTTLWARFPITKDNTTCIFWNDGEDMEMEICALCRHEDHTGRGNFVLCKIGCGALVHCEHTCSQFKPKLDSPIEYDPDPSADDIDKAARAVLDIPNGLDDVPF